MSAAGRPVDVHVAPTGNAFMAEIASWIVEGAGLLGHESRLVDDGVPPCDPSRLHLVVAPHEYHLLGGYDDRTIARTASMSVPVCTEQPGTSWFEMTALLAAASPMALDINRHGVAALAARGIAAEHLRLGGVPSMDRRAVGSGGGVGRDVDVTFLGGLSDHRAERLAELAPVLDGRRSELRLFSNAVPVTGPVGGVVFGDDKHDLLARSRLLVNVHRSSGGGYFEWARLVEAMANGAVVVTEPSTGFEPLVAGEHFVQADDLAAAVAELLADRDRCEHVGASGARAVLEEFPLVDSLGPALARVAEALDASSPGAARSSWRSRTPPYRSELQRAQQIPLLPAFRPNREVRRRIHRAWAAETDLQRRIDATQCRLRHGDPAHEEHVTTAAYEGADPEVTVIVTLYDYADLVVETLDSIAASIDVAFEVVVIDDHSTDDGRDVVGRWLGEHDHVPAILVGSDANRGLPASRNRAFELARAPKVMVMDADNLVRPSCLRRLADELDRDPDAAFAYTILERFGAETGVQSAMGWYVPWLCAANYIDAQAMVRRSAWEELGGYRTEDPLVFGWEDWELWLRIAASGGHGVHVPEMLGRYRTQAESMIATSNLFGDLMLDHLESLHPDLPWPAR